MNTMSLNTMKPGNDKSMALKPAHLYDNQWWLTIQSMPLSEALVMLRDYRAMLLRENGGDKGYFGASLEINRINAEIHRMSQVIDRSTLRQAMKNVLPPELYEAVMVERERLELMQGDRFGLNRGMKSGGKH